MSCVILWLAVGLISGILFPAPLFAAYRLDHNNEDMPSSEKAACHASSIVIGTIFGYLTAFITVIAYAIWILYLIGHFFYRKFLKAYGGK